MTHKTYLEVPMVVSPCGGAHDFKLQVTSKPGHCTSLCHIRLSTRQRRPTAAAPTAAAACGDRQLPHRLHQKLRYAAVAALQSVRQQGPRLLLLLVQGQRHCLLLLLLPMAGCVRLLLLLLVYQARCWLHFGAAGVQASCTHTPRGPCCK
jgi:hypothetical protein